MSDVRLFRDATALLSMRDSDFDAYSAYGEVVDNSIQADASFSSVKVEYKTTKAIGRKGQHEVITKIVFGDDGTGMDSETLHCCMQLGFSSRYNDRSGIGRFGVGMTLAAINQCKRVEVYSKEKGEKWFWTYIDLDEITGNPPEMETIPGPIQQQLPDEYAKLVGKDSGTVVVWSKYDRQPAKASIVIEEMRVWLGRTYRKFIWEDDFSIILNGEDVKAIDPLYVTTDKTRFPDDPPAYEYEPMRVAWTVPLIEKPLDSPGESEITIRMSFLDKSFRERQGSGGSREAKERYIDRNQGVSIIRNRREVFYGWIPHFGREAKDIDRWWGAEILFDAVLDRAFTVKNIKRGAVPVTDLKKALYDLMKPTIDTAIREASEHWAETNYKGKQAKQEAGGENLVTGHEGAEDIAAKTPTDKSAIDSHKDPNEEAKQLAEEIKKDESQQRKDAWAAKFATQPFTIIDERWRGPAFFETNHLGGKDVIKYNLGHPFFEEIYRVMDAEADVDVDSDRTQGLKELIDLLIISYSKAEAKFDRDQIMTAEAFIDFVRQNWGQYLKSYISTWQKGNPEK